MQIFISHSSKDATFATKVCERLEEKGEKCFIAPRNIRIGHEYAEEIINGIDHSKFMILLMSEAANQSPHVLREVERAVSKSIPIIVYKLEEVVLSRSMEYFLMTHQWIDAKAGEDITSLVDSVLEFEEKLESNTDTKKIKSADVLQEEKRESKRKKSILPIVIIFLVLSIIILLVVLGYMASKGRLGKRDNQSNQVLQEEQESQKANLQVGDNVTFGTYNGEVISWRVLRLNGENEAILISEDILSMKAFDAAEGGKYNNDGENDYWTVTAEEEVSLETQVIIRGNSNWEVSNIRTWLNSASEVVYYEDYVPEASAMSEGKNGYENEYGFLSGFSAEELDAIIETSHVSKGNALSDTDEIVTDDKVFLLSVDELEWFREAGMSLLAKPTDAAIEQDNSNWYQILAMDHDVDTYYWWLRDAVPESACKGYLVGEDNQGKELLEKEVGLEGFGIRPAIAVDIESLIELQNK